MKNNSGENFSITIMLLVEWCTKYLHTMNGFLKWLNGEMWLEMLHWKLFYFLYLGDDKMCKRRQGTEKTLKSLYELFFCHSTTWQIYIPFETSIWFFFSLQVRRKISSDKKWAQKLSKKELRGKIDRTLKRKIKMNSA